MKPQTLRLSHCWALSLLGPLLAIAQTVPSPVRDPSDTLLREQEQRRREAAVARDPVPAVPIGDTSNKPRASDFPENLASDGPQFLITAVRSEGDALLSGTTFLNLARPFLGRELGVAHIGVLLDRLNQSLIEAGYTTSRAYVGQQNLAEGILRITFVAGRIEQIRYLNKPLDEGVPYGLLLAMPMREGDVLRLPDIEQAVDQLNRARAGVRVQILPGTQAGGSIVAFDAAEPTAHAARYNLTLDNHGSSTTGGMRIQLTGDRANALGLMESVQWGLTTSRDTNALHTHISLPVGYNTISLLASVSEYQNLIGDTALVYGTSGSVALAFNRLLHRDQSSKTALDLSLTRRHSRRAINNVDLSPQRQTVARWGLNRLERWALPDGSAQWTVDIGLARGLPALGADRDAADIHPLAARAQFTKLEFNTSLDRPLSPRWQWRARLAGQWSAHPLFSSEQLFAGGVTSVRGLPDAAFGGDRGLSTRHEWVWHGAPAFAWPAPTRLEPYLYIDGARLHSVADARWETALGGGAGLRLAWNSGQAELILGRPLRKLPVPGATGWRVHAQVQFSL